MIKRLLNDFLALLFPKLCAGCGVSLFDGEELICTKCTYDLPYTDFHLYEDNPVAKKFWGRIHCHAAMAMLHFRKGSKVQRIIHQLKYKNQTEIGLKLGKMLGEQLMKSDLYANVDYIIPVPLHPKKLKMRGYNQCQPIAEGLAQSLNIKINNTSLIRCSRTESQTKKTKYTRYENMKNVFGIQNAEDITGKHILLIDDVITTGATLQSCGIELLNVGVSKISIAALANAE